MRAASIAWAVAGTLRVLAQTAGVVGLHRLDDGRVQWPSPHYRQALGMAEELGMRPLAAHCHLDLGKLYLSAGQGQHAQERLTVAATMYREMGMTYWQQRAEAELE